MMHDNDGGKIYSFHNYEGAEVEVRLEKPKEGTRLTAEQQAEAHWKYVESVLAVHLVNKSEISLVGHHYKTAFVHGWKHALEERNGA